VQTYASVGLFAGKNDYNTFNAAFSSSHNFSTHFYLKKLNFVVVSLYATMSYNQYKFPRILVIVRVAAAYIFAFTMWVLTARYGF